MSKKTIKKISPAKSVLAKSLTLALVSSACLSMLSVSVGVNAQTQPQAVNPTTVTTTSPKSQAAVAPDAQKTSEQEVKKPVIKRIRVAKPKAKPPVEQNVLSFEMKSSSEYVKSVNEQQSKLASDKSIKPLNASDMQAYYTQSTYKKQYDAQMLQDLVEQKVDDKKAIKTDEVVFFDEKSKIPLKVSDIDFEKSYLIHSWVQDKDIQIKLYPLTPSLLGASDLAKDITDATFSASKMATTLGFKSECASVGLWVVDKGFSNFLYESNKFTPSCAKPIMIPDAGTFNAKDARIVSVNTIPTDKRYLVNVDIIENGWSAKIDGLTFGQSAQSIFINSGLELFVNPQIISNKLHYTKTVDLSAQNYTKTSPFLFTSTVENNRIYKSFVVVKDSNTEKLNYYPGVIKIESLSQEYKKVLDVK